MELIEAAKEIKRRLAIEQIVGRYVKLVKKGNNWFGLCPFHGEHTPSFSVRADLGFFKCFGCGVQGDVFEFLEKHLALPFVEVVGMLAVEANISVRGLQPKNDSLKRGVQLNTLVAQFFREQFLASNLAKSYMATRRKIPAEIIEHWGIGFGGSSVALAEFIKSQGFSVDEAREYGLLNVDGQRLFSVFSGRIIFPIIDAGNRVLGFSGRLISGSGPKYINSRHSQLFDKGSVLYGWRQVLDMRPERVIVVEGFFDVIALQRLKLPALATCGSSLTEKHVLLLKKITKEVVLCFDSDEAGSIATDNALKLLLRHDFIVKSVLLPAKDPDEMAGRGDWAPLKLLFSAPKDSIQHKIDLLAQRTFASVGDKILAIQHLYPILASISQKISQAQYLSYASLKLGIQESLLLNQIGVKNSEKSAAPISQLRRVEAQVGLSAEEKLVLRVLGAFPELVTRCHPSIFDRMTVPVMDYIRIVQMSVQAGMAKSAGDGGRWLDVPDSLVDHIIAGKKEAGFLQKSGAEAIVEGLNAKFALDQLRNTVADKRAKLVAVEKADNLQEFNQVAAEYRESVHALHKASREIKIKSTNNTAS